MSDVFGWDGKHTVKGLDGQVSLGEHATKRGSKHTYGTAGWVVIRNTQPRAA